MIEKLSIVIPVYNGGESLVSLTNQLATVLPTLTDNYEVILVNDGSKDQSWDVICNSKNQHPWVHGVNLMRNYGQHNALLCGIRAASGDVIVTMDDDLQHPTDEIHSLLEKLDQGYDVVYGIPKTEQHGLWRDAASQITKLALSSAMGVASARSVSAFRAFRTNLRDAFESYRGPYVSIDVLLTWATNRFTSVEISHNPRSAGKSNYTFRMLIAHALNMMTGFSVMPLRLASIVGFLFTLFGIAILIYVIGRYLLQGDVVPGFPFLASIIALFSGAQLFTIGIIGEYLARIHFRTMDKPAYSIRERI